MLRVALLIERIRLEERAGLQREVDSGHLEERSEVFLLGLGHEGGVVHDHVLVFRSEDVCLQLVRVVDKLAVGNPLLLGFVDVVGVVRVVIGVDLGTGRVVVGLARRVVRVLGEIVHRRFGLVVKLGSLSGQPLQVGVEEGGVTGDARGRHCDDDGEG
ncbi:hypothetical protein BD311DRAFT_758111 [Dichomitus squalens]|uniref:Uncharacterized protein n=1 Tax=Dichomitus squalens TaxID=114155 RepID=A0A4Q9MNV3_9APHY|nr:hypothetical protein BD311DRAFT_758111 [Dichomitus squalens]